MKMTRGGGGGGEEIERAAEEEAARREKTAEVDGGFAVAGEVPTFLMFFFEIVNLFI